MAQQLTTNYDKETASDLATLWQDALRDYCVTAGLEFREMKIYNSLKDILGDRDVEQNFLAFRHNNGKIDKMRSCISKSTDLILTTAEHIAGAASGAFPPSAAILTAFTYVMKASQNVTKDYDKISSFFEELHDFLERIGMLESRMPSFQGYRSHLLRVFTAIMKMLGLATKATLEKRLKRFGRSILRGGPDDDLCGAATVLETALKRLESATGIATLANVIDIKQDTAATRNATVAIVGLTTDIADNLAEVDGLARELAEEAQISRSEAREFYLQMSTKFDRMLQTQQMSLEQSAPSDVALTGDSSHKPSSFNVVARFLPVLDDPQTRDLDFEFNIVGGTTQWFLQREEFISWKERSSPSPYLWLKGEAGMGKSFLAYSAVRALQRFTASDSTAFVAYYYFRKSMNWERPMQLMLCAAVNQIARLDKTYCDQLATELTKADVPIHWADWRPKFRQYIVEKFPKSTPKHLYLVLDGVDEAYFTASVLTNLFEKVAPEGFNIRILITSRSGVEEKPNDFTDAQILNISNDDVKDDMKAIVTAKLKRASRLRKLRPVVKKAIEAKLLDEADGMLYIDHALRKLNKHHGEYSILRALNKLPTTLLTLYEKLEEEVAHRRRSDELQTLSLLYTWITFAVRNISIEEIDDVIKLRGLDEFFSAEEEIFGRSGMILTLAADAKSSVFEDDENGESDHFTTDANSVKPLTVSTGSASIVRFHNRALKEYFCKAPSAHVGIRVHASKAAYLMFEVCAQILTSSTKIKVCKPLQQYAATNWALHFIDIDARALSEDEISHGTLMLYDILTNKNDTAGFFEKNITLTLNFLPYTHILVRPDGRHGGRNTRFQIRLALWFDQVARRDLNLEAHVISWVKDMMAEPRKVLATLAKGHVQNWLKCTGDTVEQYRCAISALNFTDITEVFHGLHMIRLTAAIDAAFTAFPDLKQDATAYRAYSILLYHYKQYKRSRAKAQVSVSKSENDLDRFNALLEQASAESQMARLTKNDTRTEAYQTAYDTIKLALESRPASQEDVSNILNRRVLSLAGSLEYHLRMYQESVASIEEARQIETGSLMTGDVLALIPSALYKSRIEGHTQLMNKLKEWNFFDLMAWLTYEDDWSEQADPHTILHHIAKETAQQPFAIEVYEQIVKYLEPRRSAGRVRNSLAHFFWYVERDMNKAKALWLKTANADVNISPTSGSEDDRPICDAYLNVADVIYHQFRTSSSPREKLDLLEEMRVLQERRDSGPLQAVDTYGVAPAVVYANMVRKIGSEQDFEDVLTEAFDSCYAALTDGEEWNDVNSLCLLAKILALVEGLHKDAQIAFSAQFSVIEPKHGEKTTDGNFDDSKKWGDIAENSSLHCRCKEKHIKDWSDGPLYLCIICTDVKICQNCYDRLQRYNHTGDWDLWTTYCGKQHKYIKGPIKGWRGVRNGMLIIEGQESISFQGWLEELKKNKWKQAWKAFWMREDGIKDIS